jgi:hypothetical protein
MSKHYKHYNQISHLQAGEKKKTSNVTSHHFKNFFPNTDPITQCTVSKTTYSMTVMKISLNEGPLYCQKVKQ